MTTPFPSEAHLCDAVSDWFRSDGWTVYTEVECTSGRIDIVAVRGRLVWAVETKLQSGLEVIDQAHSRRDTACHGTLIAVPRKASMGSTVRVCEALGLGLITGQPASYSNGKPEVTLQVWPAFMRRTAKDLARFLSRLSPEQTTQTGGRSGSYWTPFKAMQRDVVAVLQRVGRLTLDEVAALPALTQYKPGKTISAMRRYLIDTLDRRLLPDCYLLVDGKSRYVVYAKGYHNKPLVTP